MTVESVKTKQIYKGNGLAAEFPVPFEYSRAEDIIGPQNPSTMPGPRPRHAVPVPGPSAA